MKAQLKNWLFRNKNLLIINLLFSPFLGGIGGLYAQTNLVPNGSFETYTKCPDKLGTLEFIPPWRTYPSLYYAADYYNTCVTIGSQRVPEHGGGDYQWPHTGNAYIGEFGFEYAGDSREYIQVQLTDSLKAGSCYYVEFYVNRANDTVNKDASACNNMAASFTKDSVTCANQGCVLNLSPHIFQYGNPIITDTMNWAPIAGIYTAAGGEHYITIGNFKDNAHTDTINIGKFKSGYSQHQAYYFIDDVSVTEITPSYTPIFSYRDTSVIKGDSVYIGTRTGGLKCTWYKDGNVIADSVPGLYVKPLVNSSYVVKTQVPCGGAAVWDTVLVTVMPNGINELGNSQFESLKIYPNPITAGVLHIDNTKGNNFIEIYNLLGEGMLRSKVAETIDVSGISNGVYFIHITNPTTNESTVKKLVIQK